MCGARSVRYERCLPTDAAEEGEKTLYRDSVFNGRSLRYCLAYERVRACVRVFAIELCLVVCVIKRMSLALQAVCCV